MGEINISEQPVVAPVAETPKKPKNWKKIVGIVGAVVLVAGAGGAITYTIINGTNTTVSTGVASTTLSGDGSTLTLSEGENLISKSGTYTVTGAISNGYIHVKASDTEEVKIILSGVSITNPNGPAIYVESNGNTYIELVGENKINATPTEDLNGAIYSKADLLLSGSGKLAIESTLDGIVGKDDLEIDSGTYTIKASDDGIVGKDSLLIKDGTYTINASGLGLKTSNEEEKGDLEISGGTFSITSTGKAIKSEGSMLISGGKFTISATDDGIHSNADMTIKGGEGTVKSGDDAIHAEGKLQIDDGNYTLNAAEGLEATYIVINGGTIKITATDDGINAANQSSAYTTAVEINGGNITIDMGQGDTDAVDSNGNIYINGGTLNITAQSPFDYDGTAKYSGGTMIVNGTQTTSITNQMMGGGGGGTMPGQQQQGGGMMRR